MTTLVSEHVIQCMLCATNLQWHKLKFFLKNFFFDFFYKQIAMLRITIGSTSDYRARSSWFGTLAGCLEP